MAYLERKEPLDAMDWGRRETYLPTYPPHPPHLAPFLSTCRRSTFNRVALRSGFGLFAFRDTHRRPVLGLHQRLGDPVGTNCGADHMTNWVLFTSGKVSELAEFLSELVEESERAREGVFPCFGWHIKYQYWKKETSCRARPLSSVVLPPVTKDKLVTDIQHFLSPETSAFYLQHGIPYRRSYLFYGLPGTGKTSLVQVRHDACFSAQLSWFTQRGRTVLQRCSRRS